MDKETIIPADTHARRRVVLVALLALVVGGLLLALVMSQIRSGLQAADSGNAKASGRVFGLLTGIAVVGTLAFVGVGGWLWWLARRIRRTDQYPPPGMKVLRATPLVTGPLAWTVATKLKIAAVLSILVGGGLTWYLWWVAIERLPR